LQIKKFDSINVVPFIDIMLVLLVIVLTTATFVAKGIIPVDLPNAKTATAQTGDILFDKVKILEKDIKKELAKYELKIPVHINCDKEAKFDLFVSLLDTLEEKEFRNLGIITKKNK
jgi:biopolymer transport protein ExbD